MGKAASLIKPEHLARKLVEIRKSLGLSQNGMIRRMGLAEVLIREEISAFERGLRVPPVGVLLLYARAAGTSVERLIDDELALEMTE
jgi:transcriptional regulator with XRE-family HTH domain